jgi:MFS family permease
MVAWLPLSALVGTTFGSFAWGVLADLYGRRASILLSAIIFVGTSICGAMPGFWWNVGMCFLMGAAAGGMLPVTYALLAETMPSKHRGWSLVLVGGLGAVGGYFAASGLSSLLQPYFGWRIMVPESSMAVDRDPSERPDPGIPKFLLMSRATRPGSGHHAPLWVHCCLCRITFS